MTHIAPMKEGWVDCPPPSHPLPLPIHHHHSHKQKLFARHKKGLCTEFYTSKGLKYSLLLLYDEFLAEVPVTMISSIA